jgi:hypothetical protein
MVNPRPRPPTLSCNWKLFDNAVLASIAKRAVSLYTTDRQRRNLQDITVTKRMDRATVAPTALSVYATSAVLVWKLDGRTGFYPEAGASCPNCKTPT